MDEPVIKVLMVDDDEEEFVLVERYLKKAVLATYTVEWVDSFESALQAIAASRHDVILVDYNLGEYTGIDLLRAMRDREFVRPVILLTGQGNVDVDRQALELGAFDYLEKGQIAPALLERSVRYAIENARVRGELREANEMLEARVQERTAELNRSNLQLQRFAEIVASDLQQPLTALRGYIASVDDLMPDGAAGAGTDPLGGTLESIFLAIRNMELLVQLVLDYARTQPQRTPFDEIDLETVVQEIEREFRHRFQKTGATLEVNPLPKVHGDRRLIKGLLENLFDNALKFCGDRPPRIEISAEKKGQSWLCKVHDHGIGVPEEDGHEIFLMFARGSQCGSVPGVGIGLALCRKVVEYHGGRIWADSGKDGGTTLSFTLPEE